MFMSARTRSPIGVRIVALLSAMVLALSLSVTASATDTKPYTATWISGGDPVANPPNQIAVPGGTSNVVLRLQNWADPQSLGSANITVPSGYTLNGGSLDPDIGTATKVGNTLQLRNLSLAPGASREVTINVTAPCAASGAATWAIVVKQANNFSGPPGNDFVRKAGTAAPSTTVTASACLLRFANQPNTTQTGNIIKSGHDSTGNPIKVEIFDPGTGLVVNVNAAVTLTLDFNPAGGTLSGGAGNAVAGVATFPNLSIDTAGPYKLKASSPAASNTPVSNQFMVSDTVDTCEGAGCSFQETQAGNSYTTTPKKGTAGATWATTLNLPGLNISCDFEPYNYPDARQPNTVWYVYDDGAANSIKTNVIVIDKAIVQETPENGASKYRVCYASPEPFKDRFGNDAPADASDGGPTEYFGETWYMGLLPDCGTKKNPTPPCVVSWTGEGAGNRIGTFLTPGGDPSYR
jgi:hypothetical protein